MSELKRSESYAPETPEELPSPQEKSERAPDQKLEKLLQADAIIVLGGTVRLKFEHGANVDHPSNVPVPEKESKMRSLAAAELYRLGRVKKIIVTGGIDKRLNSSIAENMKSFLMERGVPGEDILVEGDAQNTTENAQKALVLAEAEHFTSLMVETNEYHLYRARAIFENAFKKQGYKAEVQYVKAEDVVDAISPGYLPATKAYRPSGILTALKKAPKITIQRAAQEILRGIMIKISPDDKLFTYLVRKLRT
jgi:uncharacterized SAM-binding protein YcdF (DUF218 family)